MKNTLLLTLLILILGCTKNEVIYKKTFGYKKFDTKAPLQTNTNIYGASLSKAVFAVLVMKLVEEGVIDLDKPLQDYLPKPIYEYKPATRWHDNYSDLKTDTLYKKSLQECAWRILPVF
jgi:hypothetical protein